MIAGLPPAPGSYGLPSGPHPTHLTAKRAFRC